MKQYDVKTGNNTKTVFERVIKGEVITTSIPKEEAPKWEKELTSMDDARFYKVSTGKNLN